MSLYHGTTAKRLAKIEADGTIRIAPIGVAVVSMTATPEIAAFFAKVSNDYDKSKPVILEIDDEALIRDGFVLEPFSDPIWGEGSCDWEQETICETDIPFSYVTNIIHTVPASVEVGGALTGEGF
jgi:hypothetical protein